MNKDKFYITTTLPYVNDIPHIGHTLEFIQADVIARFKRKQLGKENVWFNVGTDEHGLKNYEKAKEKGVSPKEYVDTLAEKWKEFCSDFLIGYDSFYRTSEDYHVKPTQSFWNKSKENGDIYKKTYSGLYCVGCEEFKTEKELVDGRCPLHRNKELITISEENYFFKLSKYKDALLKWLDENPEVLKPESRLNELRNWIINMEDISVSRLKEKLSWGVEVPDDPEQIMYVWFDALTNYVNILGYGTDEEKLNQWWPGAQIFGPDNLRFQCAIWQAMLASAGLPHSSKLLCHGMVLAEDGTKMSKSVGNVISPFDQKDKYGIEAIRYYLISAISTYGDSAYKEDDLIKMYNAHLANNFGNLLNRVVHLADKLEIEINSEDKVEDEFKVKVDETRKKIEKFYEEFELQAAAQEINELANYGNEYITIKSPWSKEIKKDNAEIILNNLSYLLRTVAETYEPIIPLSSAKAVEMLQNREKGSLFTKIETVVQ